MAILDRLTRRRARPENQQADQWAQMGWQRTPETGRQPMAPAQAEDPATLEMMTQQQTEEQQEAYQMGQRMGIRSIMDAAGITADRREAMKKDGRLMSATRLNEATVTLLDYQGKKAHINDRVKKAQRWWELKNWEQIEANRGTKGSNPNKSSTGWLWNSIVGKHADMMDNFPEAVFLPREESDKAEAEKLSAVVPVVMQENKFEQAYNDENWQKLIEGTGVYGVFWNKTKENGLGDIDIKKVNILNLYWEPGITDIQDSRNVFYLSYEHKDLLTEQYPELEGQLLSGQISKAAYQTENGSETDNKAVVVDWYYKKTDAQGRTLLHYCKYVNEVCLYSSEEENPEEGFYEDGKYPFVLDPLYPVVSSPAGLGYVDIAKDAQSDVDTINQAVVLNAAARATPRYFERHGAGINEQEFLDLSKPIIHTNGNGIGDEMIRPWEVPVMGSDVHNTLQSKIDEIKFITGNTDVNNGGVPAGVTAASAIAALKEDSGRTSKDTTKAAYRAFADVVAMVLSRITQFYDAQRFFRIIGQDGAEKFVTYNNQHLKMQEIPNMPGQPSGWRKPVFDIEIRIQRENAYTRMSQNELAIQFWGMGLMNPQMSDQALIVLDMMDFRGKDKLVQQIKAQGTMRDAMIQIAQIAMALAQQSGNQAVTMQLAAVMQNLSADMGVDMGAIGGGQAPEALTGGVDAQDKPEDPTENRIVARARERAANASRVE